MLSRRKFCLLLGASIPAACVPGDNGPAATASPEPSTPPSSAPTSASRTLDQVLKNSAWYRTPIPAGGFVTGLDFSYDGSRMIHWADVFNGYIRNANEPEWKLLLRRDTLDKAEYDPKPQTISTDSGIYSGRIAPSNKDIIYVSWNGYIFRSNDGGASFKRTAFPAKRMMSNGGNMRTFNRTLDVHPTDPDRVLLGTNNDGVYYTLDGGANWKQIPFPAAAPTFGGDSKYLVAFAPNNVCYVHVPGSGVYRSTGGLQGQFLNIGGPLTASCLVVSAKGVVWICEYRTGGNAAEDALKRFDGKNWTSIKVSPQLVAVDPYDENHLFVVGENLIGDFPYIKRSRDGGATWTSHKFTRGSGEVGWLSNRNKASFPAQILFDPVVRNKLWMADGVGVTWSMLPEPNELWTLHDYSNGNAELIGNYTVSIPNNPPIMTFWDKPFWRLEDIKNATNMWSYPVPAGSPINQDMVTIGHSVDYASDDPNFLVGTAGQGGDQSGFSTDAGKTWTDFPARPASPFTFGGAVAVSTTKNFVILSTNNGAGAYTLDGGASWKLVTLRPGVVTQGWANAYYVNRLNISADKTRTGVFAAVMHNLENNPDGGLWLSKDGGQTWEQRFKGVLMGSQGGRTQFWQCRLRYVPGFTGELLYTDMDGHPDNTLVWSKDDGASWTPLSSKIKQMGAFGFGKAAPGKDRPAVFFSGKVNDVKGIYASFDWFETDPILLGTPLETISDVSDVTGDLNVVGRCYVMIGGNGSAMYRENDA